MAFLLYLGQASLYGLLLWGIYLLVWRGKPALYGRRIYLLTALLLPPLLPLLRIPAEAGLPAAYRISWPEIHVGALTPARAGSGLSFWSLVLCGYVSGCALTAFAFVRSCCRLRIRLRQGKASQRGDYRLITHTGIGPGTLGKTIFFPAHEVDALILRHELAHLRAGHRFDMRLIQAMQVAFWFSPVHWLIGRELKMVHEFEADAAAVKDVDRRAYASLLLSQSMGVPPSCITAHSFFHHPLKRRIMMLRIQNAKARGRSLSLLSSALAGTSLGLCLLTQCKEPTTPAPQDMSHSGKQSLSLSSAVESGSNGDTIARFVEHMPEFRGNISEYLSLNLHYPESARKAGKEGRAGIEFVVNPDGKVGSVRIVKSSGDPALDAEAKRVVTSMPDWKPGMQDGKPVSVVFTVPVSFQLENKR